MPRAQPPSLPPNPHHDMTQAVDLVIGGIRLHFHCEAPYSLGAPRWEYPPFLAALPAARTLDIRIVVEPELGMGALDAWPRIFATGDGWTAHRSADGAWAFAMPDLICDGRLLWLAQAAPPFDRWTLRVTPPEAGTHIDHLVQYPLDQVLLTHALYATETLLVHAAGLTIGERALVFPGVSGAGKSTLCRLLSGDQTFRGLSDDRVLLRAVDGAFRAYGTPWAGDERIACADSARLHGLYFIERGAHAAITRIDSASALSRLLPVTTLAWYHRETLEQGLNTCQSLLEGVPSFRLQVPLDGAALAQTLAGHLHAAA